MWKCEKCKEYHFSPVKECRCKSFTVIDEDGEEHEVQAMDEEDAALKFAEESNVKGDYYLMNETVEITVDGRKFCIGAEPDIHYSASEI